MATAAAAHDLISAFNRGREPERLAMKYRSMRANPFAFLRGTAHVYHQRYAEARFDRTAPAAWCSNDLHLENFGTYTGDDGRSYFDINDFDEAALAPADWDIVRFSTSILVGARSLGIADDRAVATATIAIRRYRSEILSGKPGWLERNTADGPIGDLFDSLRRRRDDEYVDKRTVVKKGVRRLIVDGQRALPIGDAERTALDHFFHTLRPTDHPTSFFRMVDCARRVAGTGSLGVARYIVLVEGNGSPDGNVLVDLKAASPPAVVPFSPCPQPAWSSEAARVVSLQIRCQAVTPAFLRAVEFNGGPFLLKMLQPSADRLDLGRLAKSGSGFETALSSMAALSAWSQLRSTGREGSATADALMSAFGTGELEASVLDRARAMAVIVNADFKEFADAFDAGRLS